MDDCYELEVRKVVRLGAGVPLRVVKLEPRTFARPAAGSDLPLKYWYLDGFGCPWASRVDNRSGAVLFEGIGALPPGYFHEFKPGRHEVRLKPVGAPFSNGRTSARMVKTVEFVSNAVPRIKLQFDPGQVDGVEKTLSITTTAPPDWPRIRIVINATNPPVDLAFDGYVADGNSTCDLGWILFPAKRPTRATIVLSYRGPRDGTGRIDVVLKPNPLAAEHTVDFEQIWGGKVMWHDVPVVKDGSPDWQTYDARPNDDAR